MSKGNRYFSLNFVNTNLNHLHLYPQQPSMQPDPILNQTPVQGRSVIDAWNSRDKSLIFSLYSSDFVREDLGTNRQYDVAAVSQMLDLYWTAFPDLQFSLKDEISGKQGKTVLVWKAKGTHQGPFMNIPATNRPIEFYGISILHVKDGKIIKVLYSWDEASMLRQMGLLPNLR